MTKETAAEVIKLMLQCSEKLNSALKVIQDQGEHGEFEHYRHEIGRQLSLIYGSILIPVFQEHPDLVPEGLAVTKTEPRR
jgi:hypothetical protein